MSDSDEYRYEDDDVEVSEESDGEESIRNDLAQTTFEELLGMREKLGTKIYRESVLKKLAKNNQEDENASESDEDQSSTSLSQSKAKRRPIAAAAQPKRTKNKKSNPIEASSKRLDTRHNFAIIPAPSKSASTPTFRDPRFESTCGTFQVDKFEANYRFLNKMKQRELETLQKQLKRTKSEETKEKLIRSIRILKSQLRAEAQKEKAKMVERKVKTVLAKDLGYRESTGKPAPFQAIPPPPPPPAAAAVFTKKKRDAKPKVFINKATLKRAQLAEKFIELKKSGKLDKYIERKRKKNAGKERRYFEQVI